MDIQERAFQAKEAESAEILRQKYVPGIQGPSITLEGLGKSDCKKETPFASTALAHLCDPDSIMREMPGR